MRGTTRRFPRATALACSLLTAALLGGCGDDPQGTQRVSFSVDSSLEFSDSSAFLSGGGPESSTVELFSCTFFSDRLLAVDDFAGRVVQALNRDRAQPFLCTVATAKESSCSSCRPCERRVRGGADGARGGSKTRCGWGSALSLSNRLAVGPRSRRTFSRAA